MMILFKSPILLDGEDGVRYSSFDLGGVLTVSHSEL